MPFVAFCGDDSFDWDQGYRGQNNANWLAIQDAPNAVGDRGGELDGDDSDDGNVTADEMPFSTPSVNGWTVVSAGNNQGLLFRNRFRWQHHQRTHLRYQRRH